MPTIHVTALDCERQQESNFGPWPGDEVSLDVRVDGGDWQVGVWKKQGVKTGAGMLIGMKWAFNDRIHFRLMEEDAAPLDSDDVLGEHLVSAKSAGQDGNLFFGKTRGRYRMYYIWVEG